MTEDSGRKRAVQLAGRLVSLDVFRGLTIAGMVLVNNPGTWDAVYGPLQHAAWDGWTPTDLVFPFFVFIVGTAIPLAFQKRVAMGGSKRDLYVKILRRSALIFLIGLILNGFPYQWMTPSELRIPGVLQRIALCYLFASIIYLTTSLRGQIVTAAGLLLFYWIIMKTIAAPGFAAGDLSMEGSLASWLDRTLLAGHTYKPQYDPEGILSTIPAISTCLAGVLTGRWLQADREPLEKAVGMFGAGLLCIIAGWFWNFLFPINKALWSSSYVVFTAGMALQTLAFCYWTVDIKGCKGWAKPFIIFGVNALALYALSSIFADLLTIIPAGGDNLKDWIYGTIFASWLSPLNASLAFAICYVLLWLGAMTVLYRRRIFIKV
ncbi:MAG: acyltransferase family protein [Blastocatellales bacterium]